jgi:hypothetical protein
LLEEKERERVEYIHEPIEGEEEEGGEGWKGEEEGGGGREGVREATLGTKKSYFFSFSSLVAFV